MLASDIKSEWQIAALRQIRVILSQVTREAAATACAKAFRAIRQEHDSVRDSDRDAAIQGHQAVHYTLPNP